MGAPQQQKPVVAPKPPAVVEEPQDFCVGLRKVGPSVYRVVQLTAQGDKVVARDIDRIDQDLEHSARTMLLCLKQLMGKMP